MANPQHSNYLTCVCVCVVQEENVKSTTHLVSGFCFAVVYGVWTMSCANYLCSKTCFVFMLADLWKWFFLSSHIGFYRSSTRMSAVWVFCIIGNQLRMTTINWFFQSLRIHLPHICWKCICVYWCTSIWTLTAPASPPPSEQVVNTTSTPPSAIL